MITCGLQLQSQSSIVWLTSSSHWLATCLSVRVSCQFLVSYWCDIFTKISIKHVPLQLLCAFFLVLALPSNNTGDCQLCRVILVPNKGIRGQLALFNSTMRMWIKREFVSLYIVDMRCAILTCDVYLCNLYVLEIWDFRSTARSRQGK